MLLFADPWPLTPLLLDKPFDIRHSEIRHSPMHRSIIFWSGLLVIGFLGWAWWDSERHWSSADGGRYWGRSAWGGVFIGSRGEVPPGGTGVWPPPTSRPLSFTRRPSSATLPHAPETFAPPLFFRVEGLPAAESEAAIARIREHDVTEAPSPFTVREQIILSLSFMNNPGTWTLFLPYWLIIAAAVLPWSVLLVWRARRRKKRMTNAEFPNAG